MYAALPGRPLLDPWVLPAPSGTAAALTTDLELRLKSINYRQTILRIITQARAGHTGGDLSAIDILNVLYNDSLNVSPTDEVS